MVLLAENPIVEIKVVEIKELIVESKTSGWDLG